MLIACFSTIYNHMPVIKSMCHSRRISNKKNSILPSPIQFIINKLLFAYNKRKGKYASFKHILFPDTWRFLSWFIIQIVL